MAFFLLQKNTTKMMGLGLGTGTRGSGRHTRLWFGSTGGRKGRWRRFIAKLLWT